MAGTKEHPCELCVYNDLSTWLNHLGEDPCLKCKGASEWSGNKSANKTSMGGVK